MDMEECGDQDGEDDGEEDDEADSGKAHNGNVETR